MNRFRSSFIILLLLSISSIAYAQTTTDTGVTASATATTTIEQTAPVPREPAPRADVVLSAAAQTRITNLAANLSNRFDTVIMRLQNILSRLESRAAKLEANGQNVSEARTAISIARGLLDQAATEMITIDAEVAAVVGSPTPRQEWQNLKSTYTNVRSLIQQATSEMNKAITVLKSPPESTGTIATSSEETN